ncbi:MAG TPA: isoleucine--tRNA ligase [Candidatus Latescibacteria bacterium]|nr:isoleucine--tRNA ligase [Candidatus Latescibacterota bacterium]
MFRPVPKTLDFPQLEHRVLKFWEETRAFQKLVEKTRGKPRFSFLDGPITANNPMGVHHAWGRTYKDIYQRFRAMTGHELRYQNGFDCQGLWVEVEVERELEFKSKRDIEIYGIERFVEKCKERVRKFSRIQTQQSIRLGYWMDWDNSYYTMSDENNYTIWYFLKKCHERGYIYKGHDVMPWCPRCGTGISDMEIATEGHQERTHLSLYLKFPLLDRPGEYLLVWTTTPWTLTSNVAAAVHPDLTYLKVRQGKDVYYLAEARREVLRGKYEVLGRVKGKALVDLRYKGPFDEFEAQRGVEHKAIPWDEVSEAEGTGVVHIAPGCGREDFGLSEEFDLVVIAPIDELGIFSEGFGWLMGKMASEVSEEIVHDLKEKGLLYATEMYTHRYPVCWRCGTELLFRLVDEWFISMDELRWRIMEVAKQIKWLPDFGLDRELDWLRNMGDWMISKKRFWGLALPIYECPQCGSLEVIGGKEELRERAVEGWEKFEGHSPHRPWVDLVKIRCPECGSPVPRVPDVGNPWLDAGIVPFSTLKYLEDRSYWEKWFPADFITECFPGQFRNWFYAILAMSTVLENRPPTKLILGHASVRDEKGEEMHKSKGNAIWFDEAAERMGVEVMRWIFAKQNPFVNLNFGYTVGDEVKRRLLTLWNSYSFFVTYANVDRIDPFSYDIPPEERSLLDRWLLAKVQLLVRTARESLDQYNVMALTRGVEDFLEDLSNWYIRRSRRRFWKGEDDRDKRAAYKTLHEALVALAKVIAPVLPFLSEELYQNLVRSLDPSAPESVHHCDYPEPDEGLINWDLLRDMDLVMRLVRMGRAARKEAGIKVRQPLSRMWMFVREEGERKAVEKLKDQLLEELNLKEVALLEDPAEVRTYEVRPNFRLLGPKYGRDIPKVRQALESMDPAEVADMVMKGLRVPLEVDGRRVELLPEEVLVEARAREGMSVVEEDGYIVALDIQITEELKDEGLARELVHRIQNLRKRAGFEVTDRIVLSYQVPSRLRRALERFREYVMAETLCVELRESEPEGEASSVEQIEGLEARLGISRTPQR